MIEYSTQKLPISDIFSLYKHKQVSVLYLLYIYDDDPNQMFNCSNVNTRRETDNKSLQEAAERATLDWIKSNSYSSSEMNISPDDECYGKWYDEKFQWSIFFPYNCAYMIIITQIMINKWRLLLKNIQGSYRETLDQCGKCEIELRVSCTTDRNVRSSINTVDK